MESTRNGDAAHESKENDCVSTAAKSVLNSEPSAAREETSKTSRLASRIKMVSSSSNARATSSMNEPPTPSRATINLAQRISQMQSPAVGLSRRLDALAPRDRDLGPTIESLMRTPLPPLYTMPDWHASPVQTPVAGNNNLFGPAFSNAADEDVFAPASPVVRRSEPTMLAPSPVRRPSKTATPVRAAAPKVAAPKVDSPPVKKASIPRGKLDKNVVLRFVDENGKPVWTELLNASTLLFSLQNAASLSKRGETEAARVVFEMLECTNGRAAIYWITRAKFEEDCGEASRVLPLYEKAIEVGAEPSEDVHAGIRWYLMRAQRRQLASPSHKQIAPAGLDLTSNASFAAPASSAPAPMTPSRAASAHVATSMLRTIAQTSPGVSAALDEESALQDGNVSPCPSPVKVPAHARHVDERTRRTPTRVTSSPAPATPLRQPIPSRDARQTDDLVHQFMQALSLNTPKSTKAAPQEQLGSSFGALEPVVATPRQREALGADVILTPVRRSIRSARAHSTPLATPINELLRGEAGYAYMPNKAFVEPAAPSPAAGRVKSVKAGEPQSAMKKAGEAGRVARTPRVTFAADMVQEREISPVMRLQTPARRSARLASLHEEDSEEMEEPATPVRTTRSSRSKQ